MIGSAQSVAQAAYVALKEEAARPAQSNFGGAYNHYGGAGAGAGGGPSNPYGSHYTSYGRGSANAHPQAHTQTHTQTHQPRQRAASSSNDHYRYYHYG